MTPAQIRRLIRDGLATGRLWRISAGSVWAGMDIWNDVCAVCLEPIKPGTVSYELENPAGVAVEVHYACYVLWRDESASGCPHIGQ